MYKRQTDRLRDEYGQLAARYDTLERVLNNVVERDRNVFGILFESDPYDFEADRDASAGYEALFTLSTRRLKLGLRDRVEAMETQLTQLGDSYLALQRQIDSVGEGRDRIPAIQPVINKQLSLLTASYGMRIHPFYKTLQSHQGVDYTVPEGSSVFATADGVVKETATRNSTSGKTVVIDHGCGLRSYLYGLDALSVSAGQRVERGQAVGALGEEMTMDFKLGSKSVNPWPLFQTSGGLFWKENG